MELDIYKIDGIATGEKLNLPDQIFNIEPNDHAIYQDVRRYTINNRQGTVSTKNRANVRGGGKKPWRQKGRGVARAGTSRSPLWVGGGRVFGPLPRDFKMNLPKKMRQLARKSAYSYKARQNEIVVIEDFKLVNPKTKEMFGILKNNKLDSKKVLLVLTDADTDILRAGRNIPNLTIRTAKELCTYDILNCQVMVMQQSSLDQIKEVCKV